jgi:hypothetical protein
MRAAGLALKAAEKLGPQGGISEKRPSVAKAIIHSVGFMRGLKPPPPSGLSFSAACLAALLLAAFALPAFGQGGPVVQMDFSNPGSVPPRWTLTLHPDGSGHFRSDLGNPPARSIETEDYPKLNAPAQDRDVHVSAQFAQRVFVAAHKHKWFNQECESRLKVAFQGSKKLSYTGPEGQGSCEFNYSSDKEIQALGDSLVAVGDTILEGAQLETQLLHDRLGLDRETEYMVEASGDGRVQQLCAIREILERLTDDPGVMERVRKRAKVLLKKAEE